MREEPETHRQLVAHALRVAGDRLQVQRRLLVEKAYGRQPATQRLSSPMNCVEVM